MTWKVEVLRSIPVTFEVHWLRPGETVPNVCRGLTPLKLARRLLAAVKLNGPITIVYIGGDVT